MKARSRRQSLAAVVFWLAHFALSLAGYLILSAAAVGVADSGAAAPAWLNFLGAALSFVLLQPLAYWVITASGRAWLSGSGEIAILALLCLANSAVVTTILAAVLSFVGRLVSRRRSE